MNVNNSLLIYLLIFTNSYIFSQNSDSKNEMLPDWFTVSESNFKDFKKDNSKWFISANGKSKLFLIPYTDYSVSISILTCEGATLDNNLLQILENNNIKYDDYNKTILFEENPYKLVKTKTIESEMGIELGMPIKEIKTFFDTPSSEVTTDKTSILSWSFSMSENATPLPIGNLIPFIVKGLKYNVEMTFFEDKLITLVYYYEVP